MLNSKQVSYLKGLSHSINAVVQVGNKGLSEAVIKEIEGISRQGYIELPTRLEDNLVIENLKDHIWWFKYDDDLKILIASKKNQILEPFINVSTAKKLALIFATSQV
jgi:hypothetical protein